MNGIVWLLLLALAGAMGWLLWHAIGRWQERKRAEEARMAAFVSGLPMAPKPAAAEAPPALPARNDVAVQKLLFEAARKAGEAGEAALAIQLYARLLARYPATGFADSARAAVAELKKKVAKP